jgi:hypothetical protein
MKYKASILAALCLTAGVATAGVMTTTVDTGKTQPPPPPIDPCAGPISYNNVELLYAYTDWDDFDTDGDGGILRLEFSPMANLYFTAGGEYHDFDFGEIWYLSAGIGGYFPLTQNIHIAADAGVLYADIETDDYPIVKPLGFDDDDDDFFEDDGDWGWYARPHLRAKWGCLTVHAGATYVDVNEFEEWSWFVSGYYQVCANWDLTVGYRDGENADVVTAGVRWRY